MLAALAVRAGEAVAQDELAEAVWGEGDEPRAGTKGIQIHISRLRRLLDPGETGQRQFIESVPGGYRLAPHPLLEVDALAFEYGLQEGRAQLLKGNPTGAVVTLEAALAKWRGPALMDVRYFPFAARHASRYDQMRVDALEERVEALLRLRKHAEVLPELRALAAEHPYRESLHRLLMLALYRSGQQAAALEAFHAARTRLSVDLGIEPSPELHDLYQAILDHREDLNAAPHSASSRDNSSPPALPPLRRLPVAPALIGRGRELQELEALSESERLITLTGAGGSGKTALALNLLHQLSPRFREGGAFVDLASVGRPEQVLPSIAAALGISHTSRPLADALAEHLSDRRMVLVLDNMEHVAEAVHAIALIVEATAGLVVTTSRTRLGLRAEHEFTVEPLPVPDADETAAEWQPAMRLFLRAAQSSGGFVGSSPSELAAVARICRAVDGLPLALEIVAAQTRVETITDLAADLPERLPTLRAPSRDLPSRQQTMEATIAWSVDQLAEAQRRVFAALSVLCGPFDVRAAAAVTALGQSAVVDRLAELLDASLVARQPAAVERARFRMLEPIRAFAWRRLESSGHAADIQMRHANHFAAEVGVLLSDGAGIGSPEDLHRLRANHTNVVAAIDYLAEIDPHRGAELISALEEYWEWAGREHEVLELAERLRGLPQLSEAATSTLLNTTAHLRFHVGSVAEARREATEARRTAIRLADPSRQSAAETNLAWAALLSGDEAEGAKAARRANRAAIRSRRTDLQARALGVWGLIDLDQAQAGERLEAALALARERRTPLMEMSALVNLAVYTALKGDLAIAREQSAESLQIARRFDSVEMAARAESLLGTIAVRMGALEEGRALLLRALLTQDRCGRRFEAIHTLTSLAELESALGHWHNTLVLFSAAPGALGQLGAEIMHRSERELLQQMTASARAELGDAAAGIAVEIGRGMSYREAVDFALELNAIHANIGKHRVESARRRVTIAASPAPSRKGGCPRTRV